MSGGTACVEKDVGNAKQSIEDTNVLNYVSVVEDAALASAHMMGFGNAKEADRVAVEAMRKAFEKLPLKGRIVIGEGERDEAPMLYIGEIVGGYAKEKSCREVDIAVDPLEGTNLVATGDTDSISVMAVTEKGGLLHAPDIYMDKLIVGPSSAGKVDINASVKDNLKTIAQCLDRDVQDLVVVILNRDRHKKLVNDVRKAGARIKLIQDGDLCAAITAALRGAGIHAVMGIGGAPEGVLAAAAMRCLHGEIQARFAPRNEDEKKRLASMGIENPDKVFITDELASGKDIIFVACGITNGTLLKGVRFFGGGARTQSLVMTSGVHQVRFVDTIHSFTDERKPVTLL